MYTGSNNKILISISRKKLKKYLQKKNLFTLQFLEQCETYGKSVKTVIEQPLEEVQLHRGKNTVTYEARLLKALLLQLEME